MDKIKQADAELIKSIIILSCFNAVKSEKDALEFVNKTISCEQGEIEHAYKCLQQESGRMLKLTKQNMEVPQESDKKLQLSNQRLHEIKTKFIKTYNSIEIWLSADENQIKLVEENPEIRIGMKRKHQDNNERVLVFNSIAELLIKFREIIEMEYVKIQELTIKHEVEHVMDEQRRQLISGLGELFGKLKHDLYVQELDVCINNCEELMILLNRIKPKTLHSLGIHKSIPSCQAQQKVRMDQLLNSPHWSHIKSLTIINDNIQIPIKDFMHIPNVYLHSRYSDIQEIVNYKNDLVKTKLLHEFSHDFLIDRDITKKMLNEALMPTITSLSENKGFFVCEDGKRIEFRNEGLVTFKSWED